MNCYEIFDVKLCDNKETIQTIRYRLTYDDDYYYTLSENCPDEKEIIRQLQQDEIRAFSVVREILTDNCVDWVVLDSIGGCLYSPEYRYSQILRDIVRGCFGYVI